MITGVHNPYIVARKFLGVVIKPRYVYKLILFSASPYLPPKTTCHSQCRKVQFTESFRPLRCIVFLRGTWGISLTLRPMLWTNSERSAPKRISTVELRNMILAPTMTRLYCSSNPFLISGFTKLISSKALLESKTFQCPGCFPAVQGYRRMARCKSTGNTLRNY